MKAEAGELDLIEIHTKHTLKKFQPGKSKTKNKVWQLWRLWSASPSFLESVTLSSLFLFPVRLSLNCPWKSLKGSWTRTNSNWCWPMEKSRGKFSPLLSFVLFCISGAYLHSCGHRKKDRSSNGSGSARNYKHLAMEGSSLSDLESEDELQIDEAPPPRRKPAAPGKKKKISSEICFIYFLFF